MAKVSAIPISDCFSTEDNKSNKDIFLADLRKLTTQPSRQQKRDQKRQSPLERTLEKLTKSWRKDNPKNFFNHQICRPFNFLLHEASIEAHLKDCCDCIIIIGRDESVFRLINDGKIKLPEKGNILDGIDSIQDKLESMSHKPPPGLPAARCNAAIEALKRARARIEQFLTPNQQCEIKLSTSLAYLDEASPLFDQQHATQCTVVSLDTVSEFWLSPVYGDRAREYLKRQPKNTVRLFVFANPRTACKYRDVLHHHHHHYGEHEGAVLFTSHLTYKRLLEESIARSENTITESSISKATIFL